MNLIIQVSNMCSTVLRWVKFYFDDIIYDCYLQLISSIRSNILFKRIYSMWKIIKSAKSYYDFLSLSHIQISHLY